MHTRTRTHTRAHTHTYTRTHTNDVRSRFSARSLFALPVMPDLDLVRLALLKRRALRRVVQEIRVVAAVAGGAVAVSRGRVVEGRVDLFEAEGVGAAPCTAVHLCRLCLLRLFNVLDLLLDAKVHWQQKKKRERERERERERMCVCVCVWRAERECVCGGETVLAITDTERAQTHTQGKE